MEKEEFLEKLTKAKALKSQHKYSDAIIAYNEVYQTYVDGYHQYYNPQNDFKLPSKFQLIGDEETLAEPTEEEIWKSDKAHLFHSVVSDYTQCLILANNPQFELENHHIYKEMTSFNTEFKPVIQGRYRRVISQNPYPYKSIYLGINHTFKSGSWQGYQFWEVEMFAADKINNMVRSIPTYHSSSKLDICIYPEFYLSKYRTRDELFYTTLEANFSKLSAREIWRERLESAELSMEHSMDDYEHDEWSYRQQEMLDAAEDELNSMRDETDGFFDWNID